MDISSITLSSGTRSILEALQTNTQAMGQTEQRLSTGKKVNSPLDNPTTYFAAATELSRANELTSLKDTISQGIQTINAANCGIQAISSILNSMGALANQAIATSDQNDRDSYASAYSSLRNQITLLANDSGYSGTNLLNNDSLTVNLNNTSGGSTLDIEGFDATADGLGVGDKVISGTGGIAPNQSASVQFNTSLNPGDQFTISFSVGNVSQSTINDSLQFSFSNSSVQNGFTVSMQPSSAVLQNGILVVTGTASQVVPNSEPETQTIQVPNPNPPPATIPQNTTVNVPTIATISWGGNLERTFQTGTDPSNILEVELDGTEQSGNYSIDSSGDIVFDSSSTPTAGQVVSFVRTDTWDSSFAAAASLEQVDNALNTLSTQSVSLSNTLSTASTRLDYNTQMANILTTGAQNLTLADTNQESANMLMLQTRQSLGINALNLAFSSQQKVLKLF
jgi:flagellin-like hook-associated protein FlgL